MKINPGCLPIKPDPRDKQFTEVAFGAVSKPTLPKTLGRSRNPAKDQGTSLACTAHTVTAAAEYQDGIELSAAWQWSRICKQLGSYIPNGADPRTAMKTAIEEGCLPQYLAPYSFPNDNTSTIGNWNIWPDESKQADPYKKAAYIKIPFINDHFDSIKTALVNGKDKNQVVMCFGQWRNGWDSEYITATLTDPAGYHAFTVIDFDTIDGVDYLLVQNSYPGFGNKGYQYMTREAANSALGAYGAGYFVYADLEPWQIAQAKELSVYGQIQRLIMSAWHKIQLIYDAR